MRPDGGRHVAERVDAPQVVRRHRVLSQRNSLLCAADEHGLAPVAAAAAANAAGAAVESDAAVVAAAAAARAHAVRAFAQGAFATLPLQNVVSGVNFGRYFTWNKDATVLAVADPHRQIWDATQNTWIYDPYVQVYAKDGVRFVERGFKIQNEWHMGRTDQRANAEFGQRMAMTADGTRLAITAYNSPRNKYDRHTHHAIGRIYVYEYRPPPDDEWVQVGQVIEGKNNGDRYGESIQISDDGNTIAFGAGQADSWYYVSISNTGMARVYDYDSTTQLWVQRGQSLVGNNASDHAAEDIGMNAAGTRVAVGAKWHSNGVYEMRVDDDWNSYYRRGQVRVYDWSAARDAWVQVGQTLIGEQRDQYFGQYLELSKDGRRLMVQSPNYDCNYLTTEDHDQTDCRDVRPRLHL